MYDVAIIGAGVVGAMTARKLSEYTIRVCVVEKENDVAMGATKANSAIIHSGFDAECGSLKAKLNVIGSQLMEQIAGELDVKYRRNGSLVIGFSGEDRTVIESLYLRGQENGVKGLRVIEKDELQQLEPNISEKAEYALYAPSGAIICPYELTIAAIGNAMDNGVELKRNFKVNQIEYENDCYHIVSSSGQTLCAKCVINAAGLYADEIAKMIGDGSFSIHPRRGEYILLDTECGNLVTHTIFRTPGKMGKGILISPTVDGNLLAGPTAADVEDKENKGTTMNGFVQIMQEGCENVQGLAFNKSITSFCGLRAVGSTGDFIINSPRKGFINAAGIESPGLSASPAIALYIEDMLKQAGLELIKKESYSPYRKSPHFFRNASETEKNEIIKKDKRFGHIICRCETVTEGEIIFAMNQNPKPVDMDGIKRRTRAQMGRCQGGFCSPYMVELISKELGIPYESVTKFGGASVINIGKTKGGIKHG